jgi:hypothetical protein
MKWQAFFANLPLVMLGIAASYGVASFSEPVYAPPVNWIMAASFECCYIGAIVMARHKRRDIFRATVIIAVLCAALYNTLHAATVDGLLTTQHVAIHWLLALVHGAPLSVLAFFYAMLLHADSDAVRQQPAISAPAQSVDNQVEATRSDTEQELLVTIKQHCPSGQSDIQTVPADKSPTAVPSDPLSLPTSLVDPAFSRDELTRRRKEQTRLLRTTGLSCTEIGRQLGVTSRTIRRYVQSDKN